MIIGVKFGESAKDVLTIVYLTKEEVWIEIGKAKAFLAYL